MAVPATQINRMTRWPSWRKAAPGTGLPSPRHTVARIDMGNEVMTRRILNWLRENPLDSRQTAIRIGCSQKNVNYHLGKLRDRGQAHYDTNLRRWVPTKPAREQAVEMIDSLMSDLDGYLGSVATKRLSAIRAILVDETQH